MILHVHSAMPSATAFRLCPQAIVLTCRIDYYAQVSHQIRDIFHRFTAMVEPLSLDEAFFGRNWQRGSVWSLRFDRASD